ncbi:diguanylate cyclase [Stutzerimonas stutzeri]|uniref:diguanylate cyclase n=1 Tax=Stutzerimonas sp. S1 TaxID=3030652 RepID=UPI002223FDB5|nr:diguanylate cyclase [Stutzerimonas sp. S1]MCW3148463.1 diguanylate cyclase [Stutzerimonas sp. S1]
MSDSRSSNAKAGLSFARRAFYPRAIGLAVGFFCVAGVLREAPATPLWVWGLLMAFCFVWPLVALLLSRRARSPIAAERRHVLFDSLMGGFWIATIAFNVLPTVMLLSMLAMNNTATGGARFVVKGVLLQFAGMLVSAALLGLQFNPHTTQTQLYACIPMLIVHPLTIGMVLYRLAIQLAQNKQALHALSRTDSLTGLFNRGYWGDLLQLAFDDCRAQGKSATLALVDLDHFKGINDRHGHLIGDEVLRQVGDCMRRHLRAEDMPGRYGGDEFCVVLPGVKTEMAWDVMERLRGEIARLDFPYAPALSASLSIGLAGFDPRMDSPLVWLEEADRALYEAKRLGRDRVVVARDQWDLEHAAEPLAE